MKYATRMVLIPETEYLALKVPKKGTEKKKKKTNVIEVIQEMGKKIRQRDQETSKAYKPSVKVIEHLPPIYHSKAKLLLSELATAGIKYTDKKELVLESGEVISQSNIVDLIKEALMPVKHTGDLKPTGWRYFIQNIAASPVPVSLFKKSVRQEIERTRAEPIWEEY